MITTSIYWGTPNRPRQGITRRAQASKEWEQSSWRCPGDVPPSTRTALPGGPARDAAKRKRIYPQNKRSHRQLPLKAVTLETGSVLTTHPQS